MKKILFVSLIVILSNSCLTEPKKKEAISTTKEEKNIEIQEVKVDSKKSIKLNKNNWGKFKTIEGPMPNGNILSINNIECDLLLIHFWASWAKASTFEINNIADIYEDYKNSGLEILSISLDHNKTDWVRAINQYDMNWKHISHLEHWDERIAKSFKVRSIPETFLIDKHGNVIDKNSRGENLKMIIKEHL